MNKLSEIHPGKLVDNTNDWFRGLLRSLLIRTNFMVNVRHRLGWRGLKATVRNEEGWTCRIHNSKGVYGIAFDHSPKNNGWFLGNYKVYYFPTKEEEDVIEKFSLEAAVACQQPEYILYLRDFLCYPDFASLFEIATIQLSISEDQQAVVCSLIADELLTTISSTDVYWEVDGEKKMLIEQGDIDQNLPAFELALPLFNVLAATLTYNLKEKPAFLKQIRTYNDNDKEEQNRSELIDLSIGYNVDWFSENDSFLSKEDSSNSKIEHFWDSRTGGQVPFEDNIYWYAHLQKSSRFEKSHVDAEGVPQFILLTGFLGSGKTTFLKNFIEYHTANNRFVAVIQNEIGETGLDGKLLEDNYAVLEMDEGCVCCSLIGQLKKGIVEILANHKPDVIILETTGIANPLNLLAEIDEIREFIRFDSITTIVDAKNFAAAALHSKVIYDQIKCADVILLSKTDLLTESETNVVKTELELLNPDAMITDCVKGDINPATLYYKEDECNYFEKHGAVSGEHAATHYDDNIGSMKISFNESLNKELFLEKVKNLPPAIFRIKGILNFTDSTEPVVFQYVNGTFDLNSDTSNEPVNENFLILIGDNDTLNSFERTYFSN